MTIYEALSEKREGMDKKTKEVCSKILQQAFYWGEKLPHHLVIKDFFYNKPKEILNEILSCIGVEVEEIYVKYNSGIFTGYQTTFRLKLTSKEFIKKLDGIVWL